MYQTSSLWCFRMDRWSRFYLPLYHLPRTQWSLVARFQTDHHSLTHPLLSPDLVPLHKLLPVMILFCLSTPLSTPTSCPHPDLSSHVASSGTPFLIFTSHTSMQFLFGILVPCWFIFISVMIYLTAISLSDCKLQDGRELCLCHFHFPSSHHCAWPKVWLQSLLLTGPWDLMFRAGKWNTFKTKIQYLQDFKKFFLIFYFQQSIWWRTLWCF